MRYLIRIGGTILFLAAVGIGYRILTGPDASDPAELAAYAALLAVLTSTAAILWEAKRDDDQRRSYDALVSARAFLLRREVQAWIEVGWPPESEALERRLEVVTELATGEPLAEAQTHAVAMMEAASRASRGRSTSAEEAFREFNRAVAAIRFVGIQGEVEVLSEFDPAAGRYKGPLVRQWEQRTSRAIQDGEAAMARCVTALEGAIESGLLGPTPGAAAIEVEPADNKEQTQ